MKIGIDGSRAFIKIRTGIEEYSYQVIRGLRNKLNDAAVVLYLRKNQKVDLELPNNWRVKVIKWPYLWTQIGLSLEMLFHPVDVLFVPAHTVPFVHPCNTVVTVHGLEYEFCPRAYSFWARVYMRWSIKKSCKWAKKIIAVSNNTKQDLMKLYKVPEEKIEVIYEGYENKSEIRNPKSETNHKLQIQNYKPYLLFVGRLEERKNIVGIINSFEILKEQYKLPHKLILAGKFGYGREKIEASIEASNFRKDIILPGYILESEKWELLQNADVFLFPTFYEGFGIPILEAQSVGCPVVAGDNSSIREIVRGCHPEPCLPAGRLDSESNENLELSQDIRFRVKPGMTDISAILVNPQNAEQIADAAYKMISDKASRDDIIKKGYENVKRFSWNKCVEEIVEILTK